MLAIITAALGAIEIATIASQQFAKGGHMKLGDKGTTLKGKRHEQGGVDLGEVGTAERGEYIGILNRQATAKYADILPSIFDSLNQQKFENVFSRPVMVNVDSKYSQKIYEQMIKEKPKTEKKIYQQGDYLVTEIGNQRTFIRTSKN